MDTVRDTSTDYQLLDAPCNLDVFDMDAISWPTSVVEDVHLSGVLPMDIALFGEGTNWTTDRMDKQSQSWPRQIGITKPYDEVLSPLESLFPSADQALIGSPAETGTVQQVRSPDCKACDLRCLQTIY